TKTERYIFPLETSGDCPTVIEAIEFWCMNSLSEKSYPESRTAISGLGSRAGQLDAGQTENAEYQEPTATRLVLHSSSSNGSLHGHNSL
ncbi:hypothetical protein BB560_002299, partial [Smittium megazygosporum]